MKRALWPALLVTLAAIAGCASPGSVRFTVKTKPKKDKYAPRHVLAIWVTRSDGAFVKTLKLQGRKRTKYLKTWAEETGRNRVDAVTTATQKRHQTHTVTWDCRNARGKPVPDGDYQVRVEFTSRNGQGPVTPPGHIQFAKGPRAASLAPADLPYLHAMKLEYTPGNKTAVSTDPRPEHP